MRFRIFAGLLILSIVVGGCGGGNVKEQKSNVETKMETQESNTTLKTEKKAKPESKTAEEIEPEVKKETGFPDVFKHESDSGKVKFDCRIELPDSFTKNEAHKLAVVEQCYGDVQSMRSKYVEGKKILEEHPNPAHDGIPDSVYYALEDDAGVSVGYSFSYSSGNSKYYTYAGAANSENQDTYSSGKVSFASKEDAVAAVKQEMAAIGFSEFDFQFEAYPLDYKTLKEVEEQNIQDGLLEEDKRKDTWTKEDEAYMVYAYQLYDQIPILHQWMSVFRIMAYHNVDNAPVTAVYSGRGVESLRVSPVYYFKDTQETLDFKEFDEIAEIVEEKFENILNDSCYVVDKAKLFQMVHMNKKQEYTVEPVWYFEVIENERSRSITLVNAVTGKETLLQ